MHSENTSPSNEGHAVFFILQTQEVVPVGRKVPDGFYVKGSFHRGSFVPSSSVLGTGELAKTGRYGWLELNTKEFHPMESDKAAITPFIKGYMTDKGFTPSVREVFDTP